MGLPTCAHESKRVLRDNYRMFVDMSGASGPGLDIEMSPTFLLTDSPSRQEAQNGASASLSSGLQTASQCSSNSRAIAIEATPAQSAQTYKYRCRKNGCKKVFPTSSNRRRHEKSVHGGKTACSYCLKPIGGRADYKNKHARACKALPREVF
jgi:hypothetical protein